MSSVFRYPQTGVNGRLAPAEQLLIVGLVDAVFPVQVGQIGLDRGRPEGERLELVHRAGRLAQAAAELGHVRFEPDQLELDLVMQRVRLPGRGGNRADPLTLAFQTSIFIQSPARAATNILARLDAYSNLLNTIIGATVNVFVPGNDSENSNTFHTLDLYCSNYIAGEVLSVINNEFTTAPNALDAEPSSGVT